jgi:hypothetical protein
MKKAYREKEVHESRAAQGQVSMVEKFFLVQEPMVMMAVCHVVMMVWMVVRNQMPPKVSQCCVCDLTPSLDGDYPT